MDNDRSNSAESQEVNAMLASLAKAGNTTALGQLWQHNTGLLRRVFWVWYRQNKELADTHGITVEDIEQEGYFAVMYAADNYEPERGSFSTFLAYAMRRQIAMMVCGEHVRNVTGQDGRAHKASANPLNNCSSLDAPLPGVEGEGVTLGAIIPDPAGQAAMDGVDAAIYTQQLHDMLEHELARLPERDAAIIRARYYDGQSLKDAGAALGVSAARAQQMEQQGLRRLRTSKSVKQWSVSLAEQCALLAWRSAGPAAWTRGGSVEERAIESLEKKGAYIITGPEPADDAPAGQ